MFRHHLMPLCLAVVPCWLTPARLSRLTAATGEDHDLWCWHQHGRLHRNFEPTGKKQEFGPSREAATIRKQLLAGRTRLEGLLGERFFPVFTPPWNRCSQDTLVALRDMGYLGLSRSRGARPAADGVIEDIQIGVDLHTRKEKEPGQALANLVRELEDELASGCCGIMLHHQRMNDAAFLLMERLLELLAARPNLHPCRFNQLVVP